MARIFKISHFVPFSNSLEVAYSFKVFTAFLISYFPDTENQLSQVFLEVI